MVMAAIAGKDGLTIPGIWRASPERSGRTYPPTSLYYAREEGRLRTPITRWAVSHSVMTATSLSRTISFPTCINRTRSGSVCRDDGMPCMEIPAWHRDSPRVHPPRYSELSSTDQNRARRGPTQPKRPATREPSRPHTRLTRPPRRGSPRLFSEQGFLRVSISEGGNGPMA